MANSRQSFDFQIVSIDKAHSLGSGFYGAVYRAKQDQLPCAAKVMYNVLSSHEDPGSLVSLQKFQTECQLLSRIRHPNIVQYLSTHFDEESGQPVLLMELCDESLTKYLERFTGPLPYHTEFNISHDIALALVCLHSNDLIHKHLSSNNVLMKDGRAKVSDFGMSKLQSPRSQTDTVCPGSVHYMSPEALDEPPRYTEKLDIFSFGVLLVQIMTRKFPDPGPRFNDGVPVVNTENKRRHVHLNLIDDLYPLKLIALKCLKDNEGDRPTAQDLSTTLEMLKPPEALSKRMGTDRYAKVDVDKKLQKDFGNHFGKQLVQQYIIAGRASNLDIIKALGELKKEDETVSPVRDVGSNLEEDGKVTYLTEKGPTAAVGVENTADLADSREILQDEHKDGQVEDDGLETMELQCVLASDVTYHDMLGKGGQASVWKGVWGGKEVAIKKYITQPDPRDIYILKGLPTHPNVVTVHGFVKDQFSCSVIMELIEGGSLHDFIHEKKNKPSCQQRFSWMKDVATGMEFLHSREIAHRDLKSANVLLAKDHHKTAMLCDFGTARRLPNTTVQISRTGTYRWMAPEVVRSIDAKVNKKCDVFSYSMVLCELVTLELPFKDSTDEMAMLQIVSGERPILLQPDPNCPPFLHRLINASWSENAKDCPSFQEISSAVNCKKFP